MLDGNADGDLAGSRFVERIAVGIAVLIDCGTGSVANTGQHRVLASELEIRLVAGIYDRMRCLGERYDLHGTGLRLREANLHAAGVVGDVFPIAPADIDRHHFIRYTLVVGHGPDIAAQLVVRQICQLHMIRLSVSRTATIALPCLIVACGTSKVRLCLSDESRTFVTRFSSSCQTSTASRGVHPALL